MKKLLLFLYLLLASFISTHAQYNIIVAQDGSGNYTTVQAAFNAVASNSSSRTIIYIKNGTYTEHLTVPSGKNNITVIGESRDGVILSYNLYANTINAATGSTWGFDCASLIIRGSGFYATKITIRNNAGTAAQALAVNIQGDKTIFNDCRFLARQDTWYGGNVRVYSKNCYIEGTTDFIYGAATAFFEGCSLYSYGGTSITAASTESYMPYGLVFNNCNITGASSNITDLGRPWRAYAAVCFMNTSMTNCIKAAGWNDWGNAANQSTARFREYNNSGAGAATGGRVSWMQFLSASEAASYNYLNVLKNTYSSSPTTDNWNPVATINATPAGGAVSSRSAFSTIQAEDYNSMQGVQTETCSEGGLDVSYVDNSDWIRFAGVNFGTGATGVSARVASNTTGGTIKFRIDAAGGTQIGALNVANTGGWQSWVTLTGSVSGVSGVHDLYLSFSGGTGYLFNLNHFVFTAGTARIAASDSAELKVSTEENEVQLFPNPSSDFVTIKTGEYKNAKVLVYDNSGRLVSTSAFSGNQTKVSVSGFAPGIYIIKFNNGRKIITRKFLKQ
ncbi:Por secretion system C-terminal sorting domain-containing protein [Filimonas lacunae]|uniref:Por secretion system C-terminal sorting domain-containing protein n=1 Tax=Filimonas lacunae TaxID=477680 RepID=A0A173MGD9_9BACT|nr:pectinesterase family protein [Filimonas lacunae]BAV06692.1 rhamnogalacturonan acetylesterase [Filimonas lacunae]SIT27926.1 Por secretion system C-terminal sorting domain-containing protein [Filimonas lacunae]